MEANKNSCTIDSAHSAAAITRDSLAMTLSFHIPESEAKLFNKKSIIELSKFNNYRSVWIGSQLLKGLHDSKYGFIAKKSHIVKLTNGNDMKTVDVLDHITQNRKNKNFIIIHLSGSHIPYENYNDDDKRELGNVHPYDLTIHHTDNVIGKIIRVLNKNFSGDYVLIYTSDHGEEIDKGHGFLTGIKQYEVPFISYSPVQSKGICNLVHKYINKNNKLSGLMNKYILAELLGYELDEKIIFNEKNNDRILQADGSVKLYLDLME
ncbi:sulfatase-like hydrolase/transferase [Xenorhabdus sp. SGI246]|uniref:sulfatase-like hydrolase/transferase n=1 Tax=Xenorhabdus sp. SGI246 TaxID=3158263 RepID=UPI00349F695E